MTDEQLAALTSHVRYYAEHFAVKEHEARPYDKDGDPYWERYWAGKSDGFKMVLDWLNKGRYEIMINLDERGNN